MTEKHNTESHQDLFDKIASEADSESVQASIDIIASLPQISDGHGSVSTDGDSGKGAHAKAAAVMHWKMVNLNDGRHEFPEYNNPLVLVCDDVGKIVSATVNQWTDNYPYFRINILTQQGYFECSHKYSYMGIMHGIRGDLPYGDLIWKFLPERIPYFEGDVQHGDFSRKTALDRCKKNLKEYVSDEFPRRDAVYFTDPRLQYLAYAGFIGRSSYLYGTTREHYFAPHMKTRSESISWLKKFGFYGEFGAKSDDDFYAKMTAAYNSLRKAHRGKQLV